MKNRNISRILVVVFLPMLLFSCSWESELCGHDASEDAYTIRFALNGTVQTKAGGDIHSEGEKEVRSLYAIVFRDETGKAKTGVNDAELGTEIYYRCVKIDIQNKLGRLCFFDVGMAGSYQVCFIANPGEELKAKIRALEGKTLSDFKNLVVETSPETKPMLMTTGFYGATVITENATFLEKVMLERTMSRVDVINKAMGVVVTKIVFRNPSSKSVLIADNSSAFSNSFIGPDKIYDNLNLQGSVGNYVYSEKIYTYEQYGKELSVPSLDIFYTIDGKPHVHNVEFKIAQPESVQINLKRNTLYKVILFNNANVLNVEISVSDWDEGEIFFISNNEIEGGLSDRK